MAELMEAGAHVAAAEQCMDGVPEMIHDVQVEATFPDGTKLVIRASPDPLSALNDPAMPEFLTQTLIFAGVLLAVDGLEHLARTQLAARPGWQRWAFVWGPVGLLIAAVVSLTDLGLDTILVTAVIAGIVAAKIIWHGLIRPRLNTTAPDSGD